ncbi:uncharacterized protein LOC113283096 isoform X2 [Papaver somniferum]|uniref:uncharacterized protein LOC113283096 isoform X2 n=1 Tax=Papaver somniferum TaxID=3469 RepID=UPI000E6FC1D2|nr:uncharacterized protein LOC113283096 isoform X2 [Papaver somniferum]
MADGTRLKKLDDFTKKLSLDLRELGDEVKGDMSKMKTDIDNQLHLLRTAQNYLDQKLQLFLDRSVFSQGQHHGGETNHPWEEGELPDPSSNNQFQGYQQTNHPRFIQHHHTGEGRKGLTSLSCQACILRSFFAVVTQFCLVNYHLSRLQLHQLTLLLQLLKSWTSSLPSLNCQPHFHQQEHTIITFPWFQTQLH